MQLELPQAMKPVQPVYQYMRTRDPELLALLDGAEEEPGAISCVSVACC